MPRPGAFARVMELLPGLARDSRSRKRRKSGCWDTESETLEHRRLLAMAGVDVINSAFAPNPVTIHVGDTVEWVWDTSEHSTTSVAGSAEQWDSGVQNAGYTFDHTFTHVGTFNYFSTSDGHDNGNGTASGMTGEIIVLPPSPLMMVMVTPANFSLAPGTTLSYMAMGMYADNTIEDLSADANWSSTNSAVAAVSNGPASQGVVTAVAPGSATIGATFDGMSASTLLTVTAPSPTVWVSSIADTLHGSMVSTITVKFSGPVNAAQASNLATYRLATRGMKGSFDAKNSKIIKLKSASYDAALDEVVLKPRKPFALSKAVQLTVNGMLPTGLEDTLGRLIDGTHDGQPGGDAIAVLARKSISLNGVTIATSAKPPAPTGGMGSMGMGGVPGQGGYPYSRLLGADSTHKNGTAT